MQPYRVQLRIQAKTVINKMVLFLKLRSCKISSGKNKQQTLLPAEVGILDTITHGMLVNVSQFGLITLLLYLDSNRTRQAFSHPPFTYILIMVITVSYFREWFIFPAFNLKCRIFILRCLFQIMIREGPGVTFRPSMSRLSNGPPWGVPQASQQVKALGGCTKA